MTKSHQALGRGLTALIPEGELEGTILNVEVDRIKPNPFQPRQAIEEKGLNELAQSISEKGLLQPLLVAQAEEGYILISGERRLRAAVLAGLTQVPVIVKEALGHQLLELALVENLQREDLNPLEEAMAYHRLITELGYTQEELSRRLGRERSTLANRLRLLQLPVAFQEDMAAGFLTEGHARAILTLGDPLLRQTLRDEVVSQGLTVRQAEKRAKHLAKGERIIPARKDRQRPFPDLEEGLTRIFATKVRIFKQGKRGRIELEFYSEEELERLVEILMRSR